MHDVNVVDEARDLERPLLGRGRAEDLAAEVLQHVKADIERPAQVHPEAQIAAAHGGPVAEIERLPQAFQPFQLPWPWPWPPRPACPPCHTADAPAYQPGLWNTPIVQPYNNCYNTRTTA